MTICSRSFRHTLGAFPSGVTVVTTRTFENANVGLTISSFTSLSLDPPQILFCLSNTSKTLPFFQPKRHFTVNVLSTQQESLANQFASGVPTQWETLPHEPHAQSDCALLKGALAHIVCEISHLYEGGDHKIIVGRVVDLIRCEEESQPLVRHLGCYRELA